ncbi:MAG: phospho-N-acetylmuramoyl-pentapeptide-transferase [Clostridiales bacterium]|nr:MAG: phospho-N-acetylmuramoyl-pentapeptide-transferase [Clostridiales bacterium]
MQIIFFILACFLPVFVAVLTGERWINFLKLMKLGQYIREDGPKSHLAKAGTPTLGGLIFMASFILVVLVFVFIGAIEFEYALYFVMGITLFAGVGFYDDYKKIKNKKNDGLSPKGKMFVIIMITCLFYYLFLRTYNLHIPFSGIIGERIYINFIAVNFLFCLFLFAAVTNASNFTDGLDGLLASVTFIISIFFSLCSLIRYDMNIYYINLIFASSLLGYLKFNKYPAKVMMGDFGSIAIGSYVVLNSIMLDIVWFIPLFAFWYVLEVVSVIIQVAYFKKTGKRFFKMAPFHHHLEHKGYSENKVVFIAVCQTIITCTISFIILYFIRF